MAMLRENFGLGHILEELQFQGYDNATYGAYLNGRVDALGYEIGQDLSGGIRTSLLRVQGDGLPHPHYYRQWGSRSAHNAVIALTFDSADDDPAMLAHTVAALERADRTGPNAITTANSPSRSATFMAAGALAGNLRGNDVAIERAIAQALLAIQPHSRANVLIISPEPEIARAAAHLQSQRQLPGRAAQLDPRVSLYEHSGGAKAFFDDAIKETRPTGGDATIQDPRWKLIDGPVLDEQPPLPPMPQRDYQAGPIAGGGWAQRRRRVVRPAAEPVAGPTTADAVIPIPPYADPRPATAPHEVPGIAEAQPSLPPLPPGYQPANPAADYRNVQHVAAPSWGAPTAPPDRQHSHPSSKRPGRIVMAAARALGQAARGASRRVFRQDRQS